MVELPEPTSSWYQGHGIAPALLLAPPGCGKTEDLARWTASVVERGLVVHPQRVLGLTFSNKAKANLRARLNVTLGPRWHRHAAVTNFHGLAFRIYQHHASAIGRTPLEIAPQRGWLRKLTNQVVNATGCDRDELAAVLRAAKCGAYEDEQVLVRLSESGLDAALVYEEALRAQSRVDFNDMIRLGHLAIAHPGVCELYRASFAAVIVDEVQDLSVGQLELSRAIGRGRTVYAGDTAQGIYGFAGAEPNRVLQEIRTESPAEYRLVASYRSSPPVLRCVSAVAQALGGDAVTSAVPDQWHDRGSVCVLRTLDVRAEASEVVALAMRWAEADPTASIAVIARTGPRRRAVDIAARAAGIHAEIWDLPSHRPLVAGLLSRHVGIALASCAVGDDPIDELYNRCLVDIDEADLDALDELQEAVEAIQELCDEGHELADVVAGIRVSSDLDSPVGPGLHLLNGHVAKGQQFDHVVVLGLEEAILPHYGAMVAERNGDVMAIAEELAVLHVMLSRARQDLVVTVADAVPNWKGQDQSREQSRFLPLVLGAAGEVIDCR